MERFTTLEQAQQSGLELSTLRHPSLENSSPIMSEPIKFYRGPLPFTNTTPDSVYNYYTRHLYRSDRLIQPNLGGSL